MRLASLGIISKTLFWKEGRKELPCDDLRGAAPNGEETEEWEDHGDAETPDRHTFLGTFPEKFWGVTVQRQRIESSRGTVPGKIISIVRGQIPHPETYTYELPAEKILVTKSAFVRCGRTPIPKFCIAITYGEEAAVPVAELSPERIAISFGSLYGITMPQARAPPMKKSPNQR